MCAWSAAWNSFLGAATIRIPSALGNLVTLIRELEQGIFWEVKKAGKGTCKINWTYRAGRTQVYSTIHFKKGLFLLFSLLLPYFHPSSIFLSLQIFFLSVSYLDVTNLFIFFLSCVTVILFYLFSYLLFLALWLFVLLFIFLFFFSYHWCILSSSTKI